MGETQSPLSIPSQRSRNRRASGVLVGVLIGMIIGSVLMFLGSSQLAVSAESSAQLAPWNIQPNVSASAVNHPIVIDGETGSAEPQDNDAAQNAAANNGTKNSGPKESDSTKEDSRKVDSSDDSTPETAPPGDATHPSEVRADTAGSLNSIKPTWVTTGSYIDASGVEFVVVSSSDLYRQREAEQELWSKVLDKVCQRVDDAIQPGAASAIHLNLADVRDRLLFDDRTFTEVVKRPNLEEFEGAIDEEYLQSFVCHAMLRLDNEFYDWADGQWEKQLVRSRVLQVAVFGVAFVALLGLVAGYLRANHQTRGFYAGRLQFVVIAGILILVAVGLAVSNTFAWL